MKQLGRIWWTPLSFVILALIALLVTPVAIEHRVTEVRDRLTGGSDRARVLLNDLEAGVASRVLLGTPRVGADTTGVASDAHLRLDERELVSALDSVDATAVDKFAVLEALVREWEADAHDGPRDSATVLRARQIFAASEDLDAYLAATADAQRLYARRLEALNVDLAVVLAPVALLAVGVVIWAGGRVVRSAAQAEEQRREVVRAAEARAALLRGVTHDVKNPLGAAAGYAQLLEEGVVGQLPPAQTDMIRRIRRLVEQSVDTVTDLLELAHADSGGLQVEYEHTDLAVLGREAVDDHHGSAVERGLTLTFEGEAAPLVTDPRRVRQILSNLISNAVKYTPAGGHVTVAVVTDGGPAGSRRLGLRVTDDGPGIPPELRQRVFEEFFRVGGDEARGNGLGLAISRRIARLIGGDVTFAPAQPHGCVFTLWLDGSDGEGAAPVESRPPQR